MLERRRQGPSREAVEQAALELLARHGSQVLATARRYAATPEDAEDAYQRSLEILLTKAPTTREEELLPWLRTVVKHEAFALRRQRERLTPVSGDGEPVERSTHPTATHEQAERYERLRQGAEALRRLKPQEIRCLVLKARGLSYREICEVTGFTYTKVNRCLTEGRQALARQLAGIEGGLECDRLAPLLSALADGEATAEQLALLRPHMKTCLACRARLREFRAAPARVAALVPVAVAAQPKADSLLQTLLHTAHHKAAALAERAHTTAELVTGQKVAALAASAAALAGGGTAVDQLANHHGPPLPPPSAADRSDAGAGAGQTTTTEPSLSPPPVRSELPGATGQAPAAAASPPPAAGPPDPANEFAPTADAAPRASADTASTATTSTTRADPSTSQASLAPSDHRPAPTASAAAEFGP
jgi:RNA polymerase sigma factor (sigma-70 family)